MPDHRRYDFKHLRAFKSGSLVHGRIPDEEFDELSKERSLKHAEENRGDLKNHADEKPLEEVPLELQSEDAAAKDLKDVPDPVAKASDRENIESLSQAKLDNTLGFEEFERELRSKRRDERGNSPKGSKGSKGSKGAKHGPDPIFNLDWNSMRTAPGRRSEGGPKRPRKPAPNELELPLLPEQPSVSTESELPSTPQQPSASTESELPTIPEKPSAPSESELPTIPETPSGPRLNTRNFRHHLLHDQVLNVSALGKPASAIIIKNPNEMRRKRKVDKVLEEKFLDVNMSLDWKRFVSKDQDGDCGLSEVFANIDELRPQDTNILRMQDYKKLIKALVNGFTASQLVQYIRDRDTGSTADDRDMLNYSWITKQIPWTPNKSLPDHKYSQKPMYAQRIITMKWNIQIQDLLDDLGRAYVWIEPELFQLITRKFMCKKEMPLLTSLARGLKPGNR